MWEKGIDFISNYIFIHLICNAMNVQYIRNCIHKPFFKFGNWTLSAKQYILQLTTPSPLLCKKQTSVFSYRSWKLCNWSITYGILHFCFALKLAFSQLNTRQLSLRYVRVFRNSVESHFPYFHIVFTYWPINILIHE